MKNDLLETTQQKIARFKKEDKEMKRIPSPIENKLLGCESCNRCIDHKPNEFGLFNCTECGSTREDIKNILKWKR